MSWYAQMFKSQEAAKERNRRDQRRMEEDRHGPMFVAQYHLAEIEKERKLVEKELERIRKGIHKQPRLEHQTQTKKRHVLSIVSPREREREIRSFINPEYSKDENQLYDTILFLQNNPSALVPILTAHAQSEAFLETLERISPQLCSENQAPFVPKYIKDYQTRTEKEVLVNRYTELLNRQSYLLRKNSPPNVRRDSPSLRRESPLVHRDSPLPEQHPPEGKDEGEVNERPVSDNTHCRGDSDACDATDSGKRPDGTSSSGAKQRTNRPKQIDLVTLATDGMSTARENANRRLSTKEDSETKTETNPEPTTSNIVSEIKQARKASKAGSILPPYDMERFNPDGTLRTIHAMPTFEETWEQAQKARYVRSNDNRERERELSVNEIFSKDN